MGYILRKITMLKMRINLLNDFYIRPKVKYKINLPLQMAECEANFAKLKKLLPVEGCVREFAVSRGLQQSRHKLNVIERSRYTTTLALTQAEERALGSAWLKMPRLTVRMYHDAKVAEVLAWEGHKRLRPRYEYPNQSMYQCDEKLQINQFLGEWLSVCLSHGHVVDSVLK
jgi:uncharacterized protein